MLLQIRLVLLPSLFQELCIRSSGPHLDSTWREKELAIADESKFFQRIEEEDETVEEYLTALRTMVENCKLPAGLLVR